jgi:membrane protein YdbS with pleckstrin-like domain
MGYIDRLMGDNERPLYVTHQHVIVLLARVLGWLFAFVVFVALAVALFLGQSEVALPQGEQRLSSVVGLVVLGSLIVPVVLIVRSLLRRRDGEGVLTAIWRPLLVAVLIGAFAILVLLKPDWTFLGLVGLALALVPLFFLAKGLLEWQNERYLITNRRVMEIKGIFNKLVRDSALEKVNDVELRQSVVGRLLGYGTVQIITGSDIGVNMFRRISNPVRFKREMLNAKEQLHVQPLDELPYSTPRPAAAAATPTLPLGSVPAAGSVADRLAELSDLYSRGLITDAEYQAKRQELLDQL